MSNKKKRNKAYTGADAKITAPATVHKYTAVDRGRFGQWRHDHARMIKLVAIYGSCGVVGTILLIEGLRSIF